MKLQTYLHNQKQNSVISVVPSFIIKFSPIARYSVSGKSMEPTLSDGEEVLVNTWRYHISNPHTHDIVLLRHPKTKRVLIKRIVQVKNNQYFVKGDNARYSSDSREFGVITKKDILGKVIAIRH